MFEHADRGGAGHVAHVAPGPLHIHFGAGRLGLGLIAPFFQRPGSELYLLNRATSGQKATGDTTVGAARRNALLLENGQQRYLLQSPGRPAERGEPVRYDGFHPYGDDDIEALVLGLAARSPGVAAGVVVTASILTLEAYGPVVRALNALCAEAIARPGSIGPIFLVACENTLDAQAVLDDPGLSDLVSPETRARVVCVPALVDRMCVGVEEVETDGAATLVVRVEDYGVLTLELRDETEALLELCTGARVTFSRHVEVEKQIKGWLLNGGHNLIAVDAFQAAEGDRELRLNEYLQGDPERLAFAAAIMEEMRDGVAALLRSDPQYADFVRDVDVDAYLDERADAMLERFVGTEDTITRILARFQAPVGSLEPVEAFAERFGARIDPPLEAYEAAMGEPPAAATRAIASLYALIASGRFIDGELDPQSPILPRAQQALAWTHSSLDDRLHAELYVLNDNRPWPPQLDRPRPARGQGAAP